MNYEYQDKRRFCKLECRRGAGGAGGAAATTGGRSIIQVFNKVFIIKNRIVEIINTWLDIIYFQSDRFSKILL